MGFLNLLNVSKQYFQSSLSFTRRVLCKPLSCTHGLQDCCGETERENDHLCLFLFPPFPYKSELMSFKNNIHFTTFNYLYVCMNVGVCTRVSVLQKSQVWSPL